MTAKVQQWLKAHSLRVLALRDTPNAIAGGVAIGFFLGFTPFFGLKSWIAIAAAWLTRCNIIASLAALSLHGLLLPLAPLLLRLEYQAGYWILSHPHALPPALKESHLSLHQLIEWQTFLEIGIPTTIGSVLVGTLPTLAVFLALRRAVIKHRLRPAEPVMSGTHAPLE